MENELSGIQIALRCVVCGNAPIAAIPLFEMQNHFYICLRCLIKEEQNGRHLKGTDGSYIQLPASLLTGTSIPSEQADKDSTQSKPSRKDIFSVLEIPIDATVAVALQAINQKSRFWIKQPPTEEREYMREQLKVWKDELAANPQFLEKERQRLQGQIIPTSSTLQIAEQEVATIKEFVNACEQSKQGWQQGEIHLRSGELEYWIHPLTQNLALAESVSTAADTILPNFQALNDVLYLLWSDRPFRLYQTDQWQPLTAIKSFSTVKQIIEQCDAFWQLLTLHLYYGSLLTWLEHSQRYQGIQAWYTATISAYANREYIFQSLGLELLLEHIAPELQRPILSLAFDGTNGSYTLTQWDKEIAHQPVEVTLTNSSRGAVIVSVDLEISEGDPNWIMLASPQLPLSYAAGAATNTLLYNRPGEQNPVRFRLVLQHFQQMQHGKTFHGKLFVRKLTAPHQPPVIHDYPLMISTMEYRQGFRWYLWRWGLRGGWPGFTINFLLGTAFGLLFFLLTTVLIKIPLQIEGYSFLNLAFICSLIGVQSIFLHFLNYRFFLLTGVIAGMIGSTIGWKKGHASYPDAQNARDYRKAGFWWSVVCTCILPLISWNYGVAEMYGQILDRSWFYFAEIVGCIFSGLLLYLSVRGLSLTRSVLEQWLRRSHHSLLNPQGSMK